MRRMKCIQPGHIITKSLFHNETSSDKRDNVILAQFMLLKQYSRILIYSCIESTVTIVYQYDVYSADTSYFISPELHDTIKFLTLLSCMISNESVKLIAG